VALTPKTLEAEQLATEVSALTGETKAEAIRVALAERLARLRGNPGATRRARVLWLLQSEIWPSIPTAQRGQQLTAAQQDSILGYSRGGC